MLDIKKTCLVIYCTYIDIATFLRVIETARIFVESLKYDKTDMKTHKVIYDQTESVLLNFVWKVDDVHDNSMLIGQNPSMEEFVLFLIEGFTG